jgi:hypothetical protein
MTCRHCGDEHEPNRGPGYRDECPRCAGADVERVVAGFTVDPEGTDWEPVPAHERERALRLPSRGRDWGWESQVGRRIEHGLREMQAVGSGQ